MHETFRSQRTEDWSALFRRAEGLPPAAAAAVYATAGLAVFPVAPGAKRPLTGRGWKDATTNPSRVEAWGRRWPDANIGMPTGHDGFDVVDIDRHGPIAGFAALTSAMRSGLPIRPALVVATPADGVHLYHPATPDRPQRSWARSQAGVDFRGTGGYVLLPGSTVAAGGGKVGRYRVVAVRSQARPVDGVSLRDLLTPAQPERSSPSAALARSSGVFRPVEAVAGLASWLSGQQDGNRNNALFWAACRAAEGGVPSDQAQTVLGETAQRIGLPSAEVAATIGSAYRAARQTRSQSRGISR